MKEERLKIKVRRRRHVMKNKLSKRWKTEIAWVAAEDLVLG
jgi:hypothetical protein